MLKAIKRILVGRPLKNEAIQDEKYGVLWGLPILSSDAISSIAYSIQDILLVILPIAGVAIYPQIPKVSLSIMVLLLILMLSYRQVIDSYPNGGGAFVVAKDNLGIFAGVTAGSALSIDYIMTVAVSISSGIEQFTTAFKEFEHYKVLLCILVILILTIGNLRGIRESSIIFGIPAYIFIFSIIALIIGGIIKIRSGSYVYTIPEITGDVATGISTVSFLVLIKAFASGCVAVTGVEAVSNAVPNFKQPSTKYAKKVLLLLALVIIVLFGGMSYLATSIPVDPYKGAMIVQIAEIVFGRNILYWLIMASTFIILCLAANTAYTGFPTLISVMAKEGYAPRQLSMRGDRLSFDNGILMLSFFSIVLVVTFQAKVTALLALYAIGVFISFTLSQFGMFIKWKREKPKGWKYRAFINGFGALVTSLVVVIVAYEKFFEGAWLVVIVIPTLIFLILKVKMHYDAVYRQLKIKEEELETLQIEKNTYRNRVIVPIESINKSSVRALRYAKTISENITAFCVVINEEDEKEIRQKYSKLGTDIPLQIKYSPFRKVVEPLLRFIESAEYDYQKGDMITVILPQFSVKKWWHRFLHNNTTYYVERELLKHKHIVVSVMPLQLKDDQFVLTHPKYRI